MPTLQQRRLLLSGSSGLVTAGLAALWMPALDYYSGIAAQTVPDRSGSGNTLTLGSTAGVDANDPAWSQQGLTFNGASQYASAGNPAGLQITGPITIGAVINIPALPTGVGIACILAKGNDATTNPYYIDIYGNSGSPQLRVGSYVSPTSYAALWAISGWTGGTWHHVTGNYDGTSWNLYFDGILVASALKSTGAVGNAKGLLTGAIDNNGTIFHYLSGTQAGWYVYSRGLSTAEVARNHRWLRVQLAPAGVTLP